MPNPTPLLLPESMPEPRGCTNLKLRQLMRQVSSHYDQVFVACGLTGTQYSLLSHVVKLGPLRPVDLAKALKVQASTLSRNLQPLVAAGWVEVKAGGDARSHQVVAIEAGLAKRQEAQQLWKKAQQAVNQRLGFERVNALHALLDECMQLMDSDEPAPFT